MTRIVNGTNPLTDIMGDVHNTYDVSIQNNGIPPFNETLTKTQVLAGQSATFQLIGDHAMQAVQNNVDQFNLLNKNTDVELTYDLAEAGTVVETPSKLVSITLVEDVNNNNVITNSEFANTLNAHLVLGAGCLANDVIAFKANQAGTTYATIDTEIVLQAGDITAGYVNHSLGAVIADSDAPLIMTGCVIRGTHQSPIEGNIVTVQSLPYVVLTGA